MQEHDYPPDDGPPHAPVIQRENPMSQAFLNGIMIRRRLMAATLAASLVAVTLPALAHHGWDWAQAEQTEMKGTVQKVSMAPPHPSLQVKAADGVVWQVDLSN